MRNVGLLATRTVLGGYLAVHGAQKLFGSFGGPGLDATAAGFEAMGMRPAKAMATLASASELGGGVLTATGLAYPLGPLAIAGAMSVATAVHRKQGPMSQKRGFELPLTNLAVAIGLMSSGPGRLVLGPRLPKSLTRIAVLGAVGMAAVSLSQLLRAKPPAPAEAAKDTTDVESS
ncbi:MAG: DoxX family protein [Candidatus Dormibacteria bacterium]|jgi:putative oxidoreductase